MKSLIIAFVLSLGLFSAGYAQEVYSSSGRPLGDDRRNEREEGFDPSRMIYGGGIAFGLGNGILNLGISPILGYMVTDRFAAGIGAGYQYYRVKDLYVFYNAQGVEEAYTLKTSIYNGNIWLRYLIWNNLFVHAQPELNSLEIVSQEIKQSPAGFAYRAPVKERKLVPSVLLGLGIRQPISHRASFVVRAGYDVLQEKYSPYLNTIDIRFGVNVGF